MKTTCLHYESRSGNEGHGLVKAREVAQNGGGGRKRLDLRKEVEDKDFVMIKYGHDY